MKNYALEVTWHPAFELLTSILVYRSPALHKVAELGADWRKSVRRGLSPAYSARLDSLAKDRNMEAALWLATALAWSRRQNDECIKGFLEWAASLSLGEAYALVGPYLPQDDGEVAAVIAKMIEDLAGVKRLMVEVLEGWHAGYFQVSVSPKVLGGLHQEAQVQRARVATLPNAELVESLSRGLILTPPPDIETVVLVPQHHARPWNVFEHLRGIVIVNYPAEVISAVPGEPPARLLRLTKALSDPSRLRILRFVAGDRRGFSEIVSHVGLAKSTVHHHLVLLRAAGLVRVETGMGLAYDGRYSLSMAGLGELNPALQAFLETGQGDGDHRSGARE